MQTVVFFTGLDYHKMLNKKCSLTFYKEGFSCIKANSPYCVGFFNILIYRKVDFNHSKAMDTSVMVLSTISAFKCSIR